MPASSATIVPQRTLTADEIASYKADGYVMLRQLISTETAAVIREEILDIMDALGLSRERLGKAQGTADKLRQTHEYLRGSQLDALVNSEALCNIAAQLMEGPSTLYMPFTAVKAGGGGGEFHFHQDNQYTTFDGPGTNLWFALTEMTEANGCIRMVPHTHLEGTLEAKASGDGDQHKRVTTDPTNNVPMLMQPGDCVAFTRLTVHGSGPNTTDAPRVAYAVQFHRNDVKAVWDDQPPRLLVEHQRWATAPVDRIGKPDPAGRDGH